MVLVTILGSCHKDTVLIPPTVKVFDGAITVNYTNAVVSAEVTDQGDAEVSSRGFVYGRSGSTPDTVFCGSGKGVYSAELPNLLPNTSYTYEAFARNAGGMGTSGKVTFTTLEERAPIVRTLEVVEETTTTAICYGRVVEDGGSAVTKRGMCWSKGPHPSIDDSHAESSGGTGEFQCELTGLEANTKYYVRAYATNGTGTGYGEELSFTKQNVTVPTVTTSQVSNITHTTAKGGGNVTSAGNGTVTERGICWGTSHNPTTSGSHAASGTGTGSYTVNMTNLSPNTKYYVRAYAKNSAGTAYGSEVSFKTHPTPTAPTGAINGLFSVSASQRVYFSQGNLQYRASTNTWRFAEHQWDCIGDANSNISQSYSGWIDLFGWGTSGYNHGAVCYQPWSTNTAYSHYYAYGNSNYNLFDQTGKADWGYNAISNGGNSVNTWRTLTHEQWVYVSNTRNTSSGIRYAKAKVNNVNGVILLPDDWNTSYYTLNNTNSGGANYSGNTITANVWENNLESHGAVFLPAAGSRNGTSVSSVGSYCFYWSASYLDSYYAWSVYFGDSDLYIYTDINIGRYYGLSVRLVRFSQ